MCQKSESSADVVRREFEWMNTGNSYPCENRHQQITYSTSHLSSYTRNIVIVVVVVVMSCNYSKSIENQNIMVFRNSETLRENEKWFYQGKRIETVTYYKYLGIITFSSRLKWGQALKTLALQSERARIKIDTIFGKCGDMPLSI